MQPKQTNQPALVSPDLAAWSQQETSQLFIEIVAHFLLTCTSRNTRRNYGNDLQEFMNFCRAAEIPLVNISDVREKVVLLWQQHLQAQHTRYTGSRNRIVQTSVARKLSALSSVLRFAVKRGLVEKNCMENLNRPKIKRESKTNALTADEIKALLTLAEHDAALADGNVRAYRSARLRYAVLYTLFSVGMRVDELCELRIGDLEQTPQFFRLHMTAKGGETHSPIIHEKSAAVLKDFIAEFRPGAGREDLLFLRAQKVREISKLTQSAVYQMITDLASRAGIVKKVSPHSCRATLATLLHNRGVPIGQIQELLNHKQITTTAIYIKKAQELSEAAATKIDILE